MANQKGDTTNTTTGADQGMGSAGTADQSGMNASPSGRTTQSSGGGTAAATARGLVDTAKETAGHAYEAVTERAASTLDDKQTVVSDGLSAFADNIRQLGNNLDEKKSQNPLANSVARYSSTAAQRVDSVANYFETHDVRQMVGDVERFARRNPAVFMGAAFGLGMLAARFLKSSSSGSGYSGTRRSLNRGSMSDVESGQGLQMGRQDFQPDSTATAATGRTGGSTKKTSSMSGETGSTGSSTAPGIGGSSPTGTGMTGTTGSGKTAASTRGSTKDTK